MLHTIATSSLSRSFEIRGIYFSLFPTRICKRVGPSDFQFQVFPYFKSSINSPHEQITPDDSPERLRSFFDPSLPTAIYSHGFFEGERSASIRSFKKDRLVFVGAIRLDSLHLMGFSLGAHVSGVAANRLTSGRVPRITGLDPAYPGFIDMHPRDRLDKSDAEFVDVIHTTGGLYGYPTSLGHVDFYPNGGRPLQPGCFIIISAAACDHWRAWRFFEESIRGGEFIATACKDWTDFVLGRCNGNVKTLMGINVDKRARGDFYLRTNWAAPFSVF
ncbi:hypothetical protein B566_EDAN005329 [Ephemera danica]|nr:hypothetical protein B566_EDAN005329 [Ephemera danica]